MTGSPFSNVVGKNPGEDSTFQNVESTQVSDSTDSDRSVQGEDSVGSESTLGVEVDAQGNTHQSEQDETAGQTSLSGTPTPV